MIHHKYYQWVVFVLFLQVVEQNMCLMISQTNRKRNIWHLCQKYSCNPKTECIFFYFDGWFSLISTRLPGCLLPPAPIDLEAQRGRPHEDACRQPHRPHDDHQRKLYWSNWHGPIDGQKYSFHITFAIMFKIPFTERRPIRQDSVHQEVLQGRLLTYLCFDHVSQNCLQCQTFIKSSGVNEEPRPLRHEVLLL